VYPARLRPSWACEWPGTEIILGQSRGMRRAAIKSMVRSAPESTPMPWPIRSAPRISKLALPNQGRDFSDERRCLMPGWTTIRRRGEVSMDSPSSSPPSPYAGRYLANAIPQRSAGGGDSPSPGKAPHCSIGVEDPPRRPPGTCNAAYEGRQVDSGSGCAKQIPWKA